MTAYDIFHPAHGHRNAHPASGDIARLAAALALFTLLAIAVSAFAPEDLATLDTPAWHGNVAVSQGH